MSGRRITRREKRKIAEQINRASDEIWRNVGRIRIGKGPTLSDLLEDLMVYGNHYVEIKGDKAERVSPLKIRRGS